MRIPSIRTLERAFPGKGRELRKLLESEAAVRAHAAVIELARQCYNPPDLHYSRMHALNAAAETHGVERIAPGHNAKSPGFEYLNTGDTYAETIVRFNSGRYTVASWGDIVERGHYD